MTILKTNENDSVHTLWDNNEKNFQEVKAHLDLFLGLFNDLDGNFTLTDYSEGKVTARELQIPLGNKGITVGYTTITDNKINTKTVEYSAAVRTNTSTQYVLTTTNLLANDGGAINIDETISMLIVNPTLSGLQFEIDSPLNDIQKDITITNLSTTDDSIDLINNLLIIGDFTSITLNKGGSVTLKFINDVNTDTTGWLITSTFNCILN